MRRAATVAALALALALGTLPAGAGAQSASFNDIEDEVMCISCNVPLNIAESPQADATRAEIRRLLARGLDKEQVKDRLVAEYGPNVLALPDDEGFGLAAYLVPLVLGAALLAGMALMLPRWRRRATATSFTGDRHAPAATALTADDERRIDEDLAERPV